MCLIKCKVNKKKSHVSPIFKLSNVTICKSVFVWLHI